LSHTLLSRLNSLTGRFEEISTLIADPAVIADRTRFIRLSREYRELENLMNARDAYVRLLYLSPIGRIL
jgi:peptide chain release factor 1